MNPEKKIHYHFNTSMEGMQVKYFNTCPHCGSNLDPGERCDCPQALEEYSPRRKKPNTYPGGYDYQMKEGHRYDASRP